jgi:hypothetical protein
VCGGVHVSGGNWVGFKNLKRKLHRTSVAIWFNKTCRIKNLTSTYFSIRINGNSQQDKNTLRAATHYRLNQKIKFLHIKKAKLNSLFYSKHMECAALWPNHWQCMLNSIDDSLHKEMDIHSVKLNHKIDELQRKLNATMRKTDRQSQTTYPRTINLINIHFNPEEHNLLNLGLQYSLSLRTAPGKTSS